MEKKHSLLLSLLIAGIMATNFFYFSAASDAMKKEITLVSRVIDGDTIEVSNKTNVRLVNINAPEKSDPGSNLAKDYLKQYVNKTVQLQSLGKEKYGRDLGRLFSGDKYLNLELVANGFANKYLVQRSEKSRFAKAEKDAVEKGLGIWNHSKYYGCFISNVDARKEIVTLTNTCQTKNAIISLEGWILKDEGRVRHRLPKISAGKVTIHSGFGNSTSSTLYLNSKSNIWNDDSDTLFILDEKGKVAVYYSYGY